MIVANQRHSERSIGAALVAVSRLRCSPSKGARKSAERAFLRGVERILCARPAIWLALRLDAPEKEIDYRDADTLRLHGAGKGCHAVVDPLEVLLVGGREFSGAGALQERVISLADEEDVCDGSHCQATVPPFVTSVSWSARSLAERRRFWSARIPARISLAHR